MYLSDYGKIVKNEILKLPEYHKRIVLDEWVIMPNHIHMIIILRVLIFMKTEFRMLVQT